MSANLIKQNAFFYTWCPTEPEARKLVAGGEAEGPEPVEGAKRFSQFQFVFSWRLFTGDGGFRRAGF
jgi:hypothetical protein